MISNGWIPINQPVIPKPIKEILANDLFTFAVMIIFAVFIVFICWIIWLLAKWLWDWCKNIIHNVRENLRWGKIYKDLQEGVTKDMPEKDFLIIWKITEVENSIKYVIAKTLEEAIQKLKSKYPDFAAIEASIDTIREDVIR